MPGVRGDVHGRPHLMVQRCTFHSQTRFELVYVSGYGVTDAVDTACRSVRDRLRRAHPEHGPATSDGRRVIKIECLKPAGWPDPWLSGPVFVTGFVGTLRRAWFATLAVSILFVS